MGNKRIGAYFSRADGLEWAETAESYGYDSIWAAEGQGKSAFGKLERWSTVTDDIGLGTGIVNVFSRSPAALAQAVATLDAHSDGRAILGLGVAHPGVVEDFHGNRFERPLARIAEYIELVRRYLAGVAEPFEGEFYSPERTSFWDSFEPVREEIPIYNAALGPQNVRLTGKLADGWLPNLYPMDQFENAREWLEGGIERADRDATDVDVAMYVLTVVDENPDKARRLASEHIANYFRNVPGYYDRIAENAGYEDDVTVAREASSLRSAGEAISGELIDMLTVTGTPDQARVKMDEIRAAGVELPIVRTAMHANREVIDRTFKTFAPN